MAPRVIETGIWGLSWQCQDRAGLPGPGAGSVGRPGIGAVIHALEDERRDAWPTVTGED